MSDQSDIEALGWVVDTAVSARNSGRRGAGHNSNVFRNIPAEQSCTKQFGTTRLRQSAESMAALLARVQKFGSAAG